MTEYLTEQEQIEQLKNWVKQYGFTILVGILLAVLIITGWRWTQNHHDKRLLHASAIYDEMLSDRLQNNSADAAIQANKLVKDYARTPYAKIAALLLAREASAKKQYPEAIRQLEWVIAHSDNSALRQIARIRMARIAIMQQQPQNALKILTTVNEESFNGLTDEIRGDAYLALHNPTAARHAYQLALHELPNAEVTRPILQMKYDNLTNNS